ncbi:Maleylpyruvate isomerase [Ralstonia mannitolilytica]|uniref:maleylacetoacetate isomerase n=1 Tax=Ralstonia mannitolilytica TaxID=105219 RepID=UPI0007B0202C|nr:maleylacetoacetate isomerase [Ralstonia mannitolilytica]ANA33839.1 maleylacetoacetate isomerase [Ralstonia mannitolilytica]CAJ0682691.1 Maleylpyruvate isomerase [Ralstonia mannitolilytica]CAJ0894168.1 Maleylpyruvate isomerase [Ralstonia mannitolilytica]
MSIKLYNYFRSSASFRVRIALEIKGLPYDYAPVHLLKGEQLAPDFVKLNPDALVPVLCDGNDVLNQSLAIVEYLEETHPEPTLLPGSPSNRAHIRAIALAIACEIHPLNNPRVLKYLKNTFNVEEEARNDWYRHWVKLGFAALETRLSQSPLTGAYCVGDTPTLADVCLVPQVFNGKRFDVAVEDYPTLARIFAHCMEQEAFQRAAPAAQPDAV